jgi:hypothetical protein
VTLAPRPFPTFCTILCLSIQQPPTLNKTQYLADGGVGKVSWFQEIMVQVPESSYYQCLSLTKNMWGAFKCLFASIIPRTVYQPFKCQCPVNSPTIITLSWFLLKSSNSPALLAEGLLTKPLASLRPWIDYQCSCFLLVTPLTTFADMPRVGSRTISGFEEPCWLIDKLFHFHQSPCVLTPIPVGSCYFLPLLPGTDGSPRPI